MRHASGPDLAAMLSGGDRRSIGRSGEAAALGRDDRAARMELVRLLDSSDHLVRMRAADALEKVSADDATLVQGYKRRLLALLGRETQQEVRWHLAQIVPRLDLTATDREVAVESLQTFLADPSVIVQAWALNAIVVFAARDQRFEALASSLLAEALLSEHAAVRARARALRLEREQTGRSANG